MDTGTEEKLIALLRQQQLFNVFALGCLVDLVEATQVGEARGKYLDHVGTLIGQMKTFNEAYALLRKDFPGEDVDES